MPISRPNDHDDDDEEASFGQAPRRGQVGGPGDPDPRPFFTDPDNPTEAEMMAEAAWLIRNYRRLDAAGCECPDE